MLKHKKQSIETFKTKDERAFFDCLPDEVSS